MVTVARGLRNDAKSHWVIPLLGHRIGPLLPPLSSPRVLPTGMVPVDLLTHEMPRVSPPSFCPCPLMPTVLIHWLLGMRLILLCAHRAWAGEQTWEETWVNTFWECTGHVANFSSRVSQVPDTRAKSPESRHWCLSVSWGGGGGFWLPHSPAGSQAWEIPVGPLHSRVRAASSYAMTAQRSWEPGWDGL